MGTYKIVNTVNEKFYIGSSIHIEKRWREHTSLLNNNKHHNSYLQNSFNKYGIENIRFEIIDLYLTPQAMLEAEQNLINIHFGSSQCYNATKGVISSCGENNNMFGKHHSKETKYKISQARIGKYKGKNSPRFGKQHSEETKRKISQANIDNQYKGKNSCWFGKHHSIEARGKISKTHCGENHPKFKSIIRTFQNKNTSEIFIGTQYGFYTTYKLRTGDVCRVIQGKRKSVKGWILIN